MNRYKILIFSLVITTTLSYATPEFAREYSVSCSTCHTMVPILNDTGKSFLRNGLRFSSSDKPTLKKIINPDKGSSRPIPISVVLNGNYDTASEDFQTKVKLYGGGTITDNISIFGMTKDNLKSNNRGDNQEIFSQKSSRLYGKINIDGEKHAIRVGLISPLREFGNIFKISSDSSLQGNSSKSKDENSNREYNRQQKYGDNSRNQNSDRSRNSKTYKTAVQNASIKTIKGIEYSYLFNNKLLALVSYGESIESSNSRQQDSDNYQFTGGLQYKADNGYSIEVIYNRYETAQSDNFSITIPIEKSFNSAQIISALVYKDGVDSEDSYYGIENSIIYSISAKDYIRGIVDYGIEDDEDSYGLSLTYSKEFKYMIFHITGARKDSGDSGENIFSSSISVLF